MSEIDIYEYDQDGDVMRYNTEEGSREHFHIADDAQAAWAMRKLLAFKKKIVENENAANAEYQRIDDWLNRVNSRYASDIEYFEAILMQYARVQRQSEGRKTIDTPYGMVKSRATQSKFKVENSEEFIQWASINAPQLVYIKASPNLTALKEFASAEETQTLGAVAMTEDGEIIPGVAVEPANVNYTVEVAL